MSNALSLRTPKYRLHKPTGQAVVTIAGRDHYLGKHNTAASREQYRRWIVEYLQNGGAGGVDRQQEITVVEVLAAYVRFAKGYYRKNGKPTREYEKVVEVSGYIKRLYSRSRAVEFGPLALKAVRQQMLEADLSRGVINKHCQVVRRIFKWAAAEELVPASIHQALMTVDGLRKGRTTARETLPVMSVDDATVAATLEYLPEVVADMVRLQRASGMRPMEVCLVRPCDIDRSKEVWLYRPESHKTEHHGRERVVPIGPKAQEVLLKYLARDSMAYCFRPCESEAKRLALRAANRIVPLSCGNRTGSNRKRRPKKSAGDKYSTVTYRRAIHRACKKAKVENWAPNRLRHTVGTKVRKAFGLEASQVILGHSNANVTQVYAERDLAKAVEVARRIG